MEYITKYTYIVANDAIDDAVSEMESIIAAEASKRERILSGTSWQEVIGLEPEGGRE
jgi:guanylate kinase